MERRVTSHTEEDEMNQRRDLLMLARKGDQTAISRLMELYQVRVYSGANLRALSAGKYTALSMKTTKPVKAASLKREKAWRALHVSRPTHSVNRSSKTIKTAKSR